MFYCSVGHRQFKLELRTIRTNTDSKDAQADLLGSIAKGLIYLVGFEVVDSTGKIHTRETTDFLKTASGIDGKCLSIEP